MDQRKVNMLAREYCDDIKRKLKPVILSHAMLPGLKQVWLCTCSPGCYQSLRWAGRLQTGCAGSCPAQGLVQMRCLQLTR